MGRKRLERELGKIERKRRVMDREEKETEEWRNQQDGWEMEREKLMMERLVRDIEGEMAVKRRVEERETYEQRRRISAIYEMDTSVRGVQNGGKMEFIREEKDEWKEALREKQRMKKLQQEDRQRGGETEIHGEAEEGETGGEEKEKGGEMKRDI